MLAKCANPACPVQFKYFRQGQIFEFNVGDDACYNVRPPQKDSRRELFWLCQDCARTLTLRCSRDGKKIVPMPRAAAQQGAA